MSSSFSSWRFYIVLKPLYKKEMYRVKYLQNMNTLSDLLPPLFWYYCTEFCILVSQWLKKALLQLTSFFGWQLKKCMIINVNLHIKMEILAFRNTLYLDFTKGISLHRRHWWHILVSTAFSLSLLSLRIVWYSFTSWKNILVGLNLVCLRTNNFNLSFNAVRWMYFKQ